MRFVVVPLLACVVACSPSASQKGNRKGEGNGGSAEAGTSVADVVRFEVQRMSSRVLEPAIEKDAPTAVRARAALALARSERLDAGPLLMRASQDEEPSVREHAAFGLGQLDAALAVGNEVHDQTRAGIEEYLALWLTREREPAVREAIVRALGRVAAGKGLEALLSLAQGSSSARATALYALGVSGSRRNASLSADDRLRAAVDAGLATSDAAVQRAAAYAAFRQKVSLDEERFANVRSFKDGTTRIHLARAMKDSLKTTAPAVTLLSDPDWRVRVEATRALEALLVRGASDRVVKDIAVAATTAASRLAKDPARYGAEAHVVAVGCDTLSNPEAPLAPEDTRPKLEDVLAVLAKGGPKVAATACRCAVALDGVNGRVDAVRACAPPSWTDAEKRRLEVDVAARARLSAREKAGRLRASLQDDAALVRAAAAWALVEDSSRHAADVAAAQLEVETDPAVAGALLMLFQGGQHAGALTDVNLVRLVDRFHSAKTLEDAEPLLQAASILSERESPVAADAKARLRTHPEPRVRERLDGVPHGERAPGPRAKSATPPAFSDLPLGVVLQTERGEIAIGFESAAAPLTVANFVALARDGFYDGLRFHRVVPDFVAQGGDPRGDGSGGPGYTVPCENTDARYRRGAVGMALAGKDTGGSQFFLTHSEQPHLDGRYTLFGYVADGFEAMDALQPGDRILGLDFTRAVPRREASR